MALGVLLWWNKMASILFVCLANVCRSPAAQAILEHMAKEAGHLDLVVDSCGIGSWHVGHLADERMQKVAQIRGIPLSHKAKQFKEEYFEEFDYILAADKEVLSYLFSWADKVENKAKIHLITEFSVCYQGQDIPDPYYQGEPGFDYVMDMLEDSCQGLLLFLGKSPIK